MVFQGHWNDGRSAQRHAVRVRLLGRSLVLTQGDDRPLLSLPVAGLRLTEEVYAGRPLRLSHTDHPDARLTVDDHALLEKLCELSPRLNRRHLARRGAWARFAIWSGALAATVAGLVVTVPLAAGPIARAVPASWETALGEQVSQILLAGERHCQGTAGDAALAGLVERLAPGTAMPYPYRVRVIASDGVNAFAGPGGQIVIFNGLLQQAESPQIVAAVLAHEMAHVMERHPTRGLIRRTGYRLLAAALVGDLSSVMALLGESGELLLNLAHSREDEAAADRLAIGLLNSAGIDSRGLGAFFEQLQHKQGGGQPPALLSTHPLHAERIAQARVIERDGRAALTPAEWHALKSICQQP